MTTMFRVQYGTPRPVEVEAETPACPNRDSDGQTIFREHTLPRASERVGLLGPRTSSWLEA